MPEPERRDQGVEKGTQKAPSGHDKDSDTNAKRGTYRGKHIGLKKRFVFG